MTPSSQPTKSPSSQPTKSPSSQPTKSPSSQPTKSLADLMRGYQAAEIVCAVRGTVVRRLAVCDSTLEIDASGPWGREEFAAPLDTAISLRPWFMDRGDVVLTVDGQTIKLCTEYDLIRYEDGTTDTVQP